MTGNNWEQEHTEIRKDPLSGTWVLIAPQRAHRPMEFSIESGEEAQSETDKEHCPFCPGNELMTPPELLSYREPGTGSNQSGWSLRVVRNKFPALVSTIEPLLTGDSLYQSMTGFGYHEVVIETPSHTDDYDDMSLTDVENVIWAWRDRLLSLHSDQRIKYALVFKNHGMNAGASLKHAHSQIIATPLIPKKIEQEVNALNEYITREQRCLICDIIRREQYDGKRVVYQNEDFVCFCPYASSMAYQVMLAPVKHCSEFVDMTDDEVKHLAIALRHIFKMFRNALGDISYNMWLHNEPWHNSDNDGKSFHWHIDVTPKLAHLAGFEVGSGFFINHTPPEDAASLLRSAISNDD